MSPAVMGQPEYDESDVLFIVDIREDATLEHPAEDLSAWIGETLAEHLAAVNEELARRGYHATVTFRGKAG